jgi:membrane protein
MTEQETPKPIPSQRIAEKLPHRLQGTWALAVALVNGVRQHRVSMLARQAAYSLLYAIPSAIVLAVSLANIIDQRTGSHLYDLLSNAIDDRAPDEFVGILNDLLQHALLDTSTSAATVAAVISILIAIWGGAGGMGALVFACNDVYDVGDKRSWVLRKFLTLMLTVLGAIMAITTLLLFTLGDRIANWLAKEFEPDVRLTNLLSSGRIISTVLVFTSLYLLYWIAPDVEKTFRWLIPGTAAATISVILVFALISTFLKFISPGGGYGVAGVAGGMLVLLWFLYLLSLIVIVGAVINAVVSEHFDPKVMRFLKEHPERRVRPAAEWIEHPPESY